MSIYKEILLKLPKQYLSKANGEKLDINDDLHFYTDNKDHNANMTRLFELYNLFHWRRQDPLFKAPDLGEFLHAYNEIYPQAVDAELIAPPDKFVEFCSTIPNQLGHAFVTLDTYKNKGIVKLTKYFYYNSVFFCTYYQSKFGGFIDRDLLIQSIKEYCTSHPRYAKDAGNWKMNASVDKQQVIALKDSVILTAFEAGNAPVKEYEFDFGFDL